LEAERATAQGAMMRDISAEVAKLQSLKVDPAILLNARLIEALEKMAEDPATKIVIPTDVLQLLEQMRPTEAANVAKETGPEATPQPPATAPSPGNGGASTGDTKSA
jgi:hypothetical protein